MFHDILQHHILERVEEMVPLIVVHLLDTQRVESGCDIFLFHHETDKEILIRQLFLVGVRYKAVEHVVVLYRRV